MDKKRKTPEFKSSEDVLKGETADIYFDHTLSILRSENLNPVAVMEFFSGRAGILCGAWPRRKNEANPTEGASR